LVARIVLVVVLSAVVAGCGGRSETARDRPAQLDPSRGDVAVVGTETITSPQVDAVLDETAASFRAVGRPFPAAGTPYYLDLRDQAVEYLLRRSAREQEADRLNVSVDQGDVDAEFDRLDPAALQREEQRMGLTVERIRTDIRDRQLLMALFAAVVARKPENESGLEAMRAWDDHVSSEVRSTDFAPGWEPSDEPRSPIPPELQNLPEPHGACDLHTGIYKLREVAAHGCMATLGIPLPGKTGKLCPDIPIRDSFTAYNLPPDGPYLQYQESLMDTAPSCAPYPDTTFTFRDDRGGCRDDLCNYGTPSDLSKGARIPSGQSPSKQ
jgi:SurA-like N-terminal domain